MSGTLDDLARKLGHRFQDVELLRQALTHPSVARSRGAPKATPYERLEFLGDRVLGLVVAHMLFEHFPLEPEGALARRHAALVRKESLARVALDLGLDRLIRLGKGDEEAGGRANPSLLADACEAVMGALYADAGFAVAEQFVRGRWLALMNEPSQPPKDAKTALQEWLQGRGLPLPVYRTVGMEGPSHDPMFKICVEVKGHPPIIAEAKSKRVAEQAAAAAMLEQLTQ